MDTRKILTIIFFVIFALVLVVGFYYVGSPEHNRNLNADKERMEDLSYIRNGINKYYRENCKLPDSLDELEIIQQNPAMKRPYSYRHNSITHPIGDYELKSGDKENEYQLCTEFYAESEGYNPKIAEPIIEYVHHNISHPAGHHCFKLKLDSWAHEKCEKKKPQAN